MSNVRDVDISLWLHNKLGTTNDTWSSGSICAQLNPEVLRNIKECFPDLQTQVKLKLLLSLFQIPRRNLEEWKSELEDIVKAARSDSELWVGMLVEIMKSYPSTGSLNLEINDVDESRPIFSDLLNDLRKLIRKQSADSILLPLECLYLNKASLAASVGQPTSVTNHFMVRKKPKSVYLRIELLQKSHDATTNLKKASAPVIPVRTRGMPRKMTDTTPLKGLPSRTLNSSFGRTINNSINRTNVPRNSTGRKDGGIKFLDINEQPLGYQQMKKRRKIEAEGAKKNNEQHHHQQQQQQQTSSQNSSANNTITTNQALPVTNINDSELIIYSEQSTDQQQQQQQNTIITPEYAAGLNSSLSYAPPTPQQNIMQQDTILIMNQTRLSGVEEQQPQQMAIDQKPIIIGVQNNNSANYSQLQQPEQPEQILHTQSSQQQQQQQTPQLSNQVRVLSQPINNTANISRKGIVLTKEQMLEAQEMFRTANKVTRPEKALILGFMAGARDNPCPDLGSIVTIKLSEYQENILQSDQVTCLSMIVETHFQMNFNNGEWKRIKKYRNAITQDVNNSI